MRPLRTFLWHNIMIHRTQRLCLIEKKKERDCKLAKTFACQLRKHCTIFSSLVFSVWCAKHSLHLGTDAPISKFLLGFYQEVILILSSDSFFAFFPASSPTLNTGFYDLLVISATQYPSCLLPGLWTWDLKGKVWETRFLRKITLFHGTVLSALNLGIVCYCSAGTLG